MIETTLDGLTDLVGPVDFSRVDVSAQSSSSGTTVKADIHATALETIDSLQMDYCGPPLTFLSVDGSTVAVTHEDDRLHAPLHAPLQAGTGFALRFLTVVPLDHVAEHDIGDVAADLLCR